jgi:hypothetical protein
LRNILIINVTNKNLSKGIPAIFQKYRATVKNPITFAEKGGFIVRNLLENTRSISSHAIFENVLKITPLEF